MADYKGTSLTASMENEKAAMLILSNSLLRALWREHPDKMESAIAHGRKVRKP